MKLCEEVQEKVQEKKLPWAPTYFQNHCFFNNFTSRAPNHSNKASFESAHFNLHIQSLCIITLSRRIAWNEDVIMRNRFSEL